MKRLIVYVTQFYQLESVWKMCYAEDLKVAPKGKVISAIMACLGRDQ
jgi:hypothetical protein